MLEKAGHTVDAAEVILFYVLGNSVWANGNKEASILSDTKSILSVMKDCFIASQRFKSLRGEIISLRKIIDYHLDLAPSEYVWVDDAVLNIIDHVENSISKNRVSLQTLTYFWNLWKEKIVNILNSLNSLGTQDEQDYKSYENITKVGNDFYIHAYGPFRQGLIALNSYQVAKPIIESKILNKKLPRELLKCLKHSKQRFFVMFCPRGPKRECYKHVMDLRLTELSKDLINGATIEIMSKKGRLRYVEMWSVVLQIFMFGNLSEKLYQVILQRSDLSPAYNAFIKQLKRSKISGSVSVSLVSNFEKSLQETFNHNWKSDFDFMPPFWFVYFLERLLFLVSSWHGSFFTLKSSVYETIPWGNLRCNASPLSVADSKSGLLPLSGLEIGSLGYFNPFELWTYDIIAVLPPVFVKILAKRPSMPFGKLLADILNAIGDPLVCLKSGDIQREFLSHSVLEIDVDLIHSREDIFRILYPENSDCDRNDKMESGNPNDENVCFSNFDHMGYSEYPTESDDAIPDYHMERAELATESEEFDIVSFSQLFTNLSRVYMFSKRIFEDISYHDCKPQMKVCFIVLFLFTFLLQ
ncbi:hypothetical protein MKW98_022945 [Papaver atlanticum]|uniref:Uncharacterized protein n=1 Tax=Papaver atlanticum TaxID=357466 RepID=A0AAD4XZA9_9MAGN|nr:hypothetical protein MKW98_022945 [Papaver atlanticum]